MEKSRSAGLLKMFPHPPLFKLNVLYMCTSVLVFVATRNKGQHSFIFHFLIHYKRDSAPCI